MAWFYFVVLADGEGRANPVVQVVMASGKFVQFAFPLIYVWLVDRKELGWPAFRSKGLLFGFLFGLATVFVMMGLYYAGLKELILGSDTPRQIINKLNQLEITTPLRYLFLAVFISLFHSLLEEYYWRWFVFGRLNKQVSLSWAILISSVGFMIHHIIVLGVYFPGYFWTLAMPFSICVGIGGGVWAWLYNKTRSIYAIWLSHLVVDAGIMLVGYDLVQNWIR